MIIIFGPPGAGKSVQGQILAARLGWRWLSAGQLLRDAKDPELAEIMHSGRLVPHEYTNRVLGDALERARSLSQIILDGYPRDVEQAQWLLDNAKTYDRHVDIAIALEVPKEEIVKRLALRGRHDDEPTVIDGRIALYEQEVTPIIGVLKAHDVPVVTVDGVGTVGQVHDRIVADLVERGLTSL